MDKELAFKWADELESGNSLQGRRSLEWEGRRCCLGVLARMQCKNDPSRVSVSKVSGKTFFDERPGLLSDRLKIETGIKTDNGIIYSLRDRSGFPVSLAELNDLGLTFSQIADLIRYFYEEL